jgi:hypothetical protein
VNTVAKDTEPKLDEQPAPAEGENPEPDVTTVDTDVAKPVKPKDIEGRVHVPDVFVAQVRPK